MLTNLSGLENITMIDGFIQIINNDNLASVQGMQNIDSLSIKFSIPNVSGLQIKNNPLLSACANESFCGYLNLSEATYIIENNLTGCNSKADIQIGCEFVGINDAKSAEIKIYPNPTTSIISIDVGKIKQSLEVTIWNSQGQIIKKQQMNNSSILETDIDGPAGIYLIGIKTLVGPTSVFRVSKIDSSH